MLNVVYEPSYIDIFHKIDTNVEVPAGTILMKKDGDTVKVSDGTAVWGVLSQDVFINPGNRFALPYNAHEAYAGDYVGIYHDGMFETDQFEDGSYTPGAKLYAGESGKFAATGTIVVGKVVNKIGNKLFVKLGS